MAPHPGKGQALGCLPVKVCTGRRPPGARLPKLGGSAWGDGGSGQDNAEVGAPKAGEGAGGAVRAASGCRHLGPAPLQPRPASPKRVAFAQEWGHGGKAAVLARSSCSTRGQKGTFPWLWGRPSRKRSLRPGTTPWNRLGGICHSGHREGRARSAPSAPRPPLERGPEGGSQTPTPAHGPGEPPQPPASHSPAARGVTALRHPGLRVRFRESASARRAARAGSRAIVSLPAPHQPPPF